MYGVYKILCALMWTKVSRVWLVNLAFILDKLRRSLIYGLLYSADFGFARHLQGADMAATLCGSPMYMAPEVLMGHTYCGKADLYSIGTIVYQCLAGRAPFHATSPQELRSYYERTDYLKPTIPNGTSTALKELICALLIRNPKERLAPEQFFTHSFIRNRSSTRRQVRFVWNERFW